MKYLITGASGQLGFDIKRELLKRGIAEKDIFTPHAAELDITDKNAVDNQVTAFCPDTIFHCAAYTNVDGAETDRESCERVNVEGTKNLAAVATKINSKLIYISTDYVFDGTNPEPYQVDDAPNPKSVYGSSKYQGEIEAAKCPKHFIVRTAWVFGINGKNFIRTMLNLGKTNGEISVVADQIGSPTYTVDLARLLVDISETEKYGIYHATNEGFCSWADFAEYIFETAHMPVKVKRVSTAEYSKIAGHSQAKRPQYSKLDKTKLTASGFEPLPAWQDAVERFMKELQEEEKQ